MTHSGPADDALQALVQQFSERSSFVRELIQNSLDAGAGRVEVRLSVERGRLRIDVEDDGEGMDRDIIERYLLTLFRSSKEKDLTKIGKFGIGFVSLFALAPELVVVNTGRDGVFYRVLFDEAREYTLAEVDEPFEGTAVTLFVPGRTQDHRALATEIREAAHYWCRYARAEIWTACDEKWGWPPEQVSHDFSVSAPFSQTIEEDGVRVVLGFTPEPVPQVGYYNHGLTLLEAEEAAVPGVTFRVEARTLEHTLTRDNVMRDRNYRRVIQRIESLARGPLRTAYLTALREASSPDALAALLSVAHLPVVSLPDDLACLRTAGGQRVSLGELRPGLLRRLFSRELLFASGPSPLVDALSAAGRAVLLGPPDTHPDVGVARRAGLGEPVDIHERWILPEIVEPHPLVTAVADGIGVMGAWRPCLPARFHDRGDAIVDRLVSWQSEPGTLEHRTFEEADRTPPRGATILFNVEHPVFARFSAVPARVAAPLLRQAARRVLKEPGGFSADGLKQALAGASS